MNKIDLATIPRPNPGENFHYQVITAVSALRRHIGITPDGEAAELCQKIGYVADFLQAAADMFIKDTSSEGAV